MLDSMTSVLYSPRMGNKLLPEAVLTSPVEAMRLNAWAIAAVIISFLSRWWSNQQTAWNVGLRIVLAIAPLVPSLLWARTIARWVRSLDELQRRIQYEAWIFASVGTVFFLTALSLIQSA